MAGPRRRSNPDPKEKPNNPEPEPEQERDAIESAPLPENPIARQLEYADVAERMDGVASRLLKVDARSQVISKEIAELLKQGAPKFWVQPVGAYGASLEFSRLFGKIAQALIRAASNFTDLQRSGVNPYFNSRYSTAKDVEDATKVHLEDQGILAIHGTRLIEHPEVRQLDTDTGKETVQVRARYAISTMLLHAESEQWFRNTVVIDGKDTSAHAAGSCITYGMRYNLQALLNLAGEDDDGNAGVAAPTGTPNAKGRQTAGDRATGPKPPADPAAAAAAKALWVSIQKRVAFRDGVKDHTEADEQVCSTVLQRCTKFQKGDGSWFTGVTDWRNIKKKGMAEASLRRLSEDPEWGDDALEDLDREE